MKKFSELLTQAKDAIADVVEATIGDHTEQAPTTVELPTEPLIEWSRPEDLEAGRKLAAGDKPRTEDEEKKIARGQLHGDYKGHRAAMKKKHNITEGTDDDLENKSLEFQPQPEDTEGTDAFDEALIVQPLDDLNETFEVVRGVADIAEGEIVDNIQLANLEENGYKIVIQSIDEAKYHVHAEVSPKGIPLTKNHRIAVTAKSEAEAKKNAHAYTKERGWKIHNIQRVTLAEGDETLAEGEETGELENQEDGPKTFMEITAPLVTETTKHSDDQLRRIVARGETDEKGMSPAFGMQVRAARDELKRRGKHKFDRSKYLS